MVYFVTALKVQLLIWTLLASSTTSENSIKGHLPDLGVISQFLEQFIKPYIQSIRQNNNVRSVRAKEETAIDKAIGKKLAALTHLLQDDDSDKASLNETSDNLALEGNDETTIIEFMPKHTFKKKGKAVHKDKESKPDKEKESFRRSISKYKRLRQAIKNMLDRERAGSRTKLLITRTLDDMLAQLIETQCTWKPTEQSDIQSHIFRARKDTHKSISKLHKLSNLEWKNLRKQYLDFLNFKKGHEDNFMKQFHEFFTSVMNDTWNLSSRYKVRCQLIKVDDKLPPPEKQFLREDKVVGKDQCDSFKVCSTELKDFLSNFYKYLNDTGVSTFRNYAAMYIRDVNVDFGLDKDIVVSVIENISNIAERKVSKLYKKEIDKFSLDDSKAKTANIQRISDFITACIEQAKKTLKKNLDHELGAMKTKLFSTVKADLNVNLRLDMDNLGKVFKDRICPLFVLCNGKYAARRLDKLKAFNQDTDNIYVKVQLTLDDELKETIARTGSFGKSWHGKDMTHRFNKYNLNQNDRKFMVLNITRTTITRTTVTTTPTTTTSSGNNTTLKSTNATTRPSTTAETTTQKSNKTKNLDSEAVVKIIDNVII